MNELSEKPSQPGAGTLLAALRQQRAVGIQEISQRLKFSSRQISALEAGQYDALPDMTFVRAMIRAYARYLGADPEPFIQALELERPDAVPKLMTAATVTVPARGVGFFREARTASSRRWIIAGLLVLATAVVIAWVWHSEASPETPVGASGVAGSDAAHPEPPKPLPPEP